MTVIEGILRNFGISKRYKGYDHMVYCISLAVDDDFRLLSITKDLYMETAEHFGCDWTNVERNIRTVVSRAWQVNPTLMSEMAGYPLTAPPMVSEFIEIVASYILRTRDQSMQNVK